MKALIKYWLRKFCGGNLFQVLGHARAYSHPGYSPNPRFEIPIVISGKRFFLRANLDELKTLLREPMSFEVSTTRDRLLWPCLPLLTFGRLFDIADTNPLVTWFRRLWTRYLMLKAGVKLQWTRFKTFCRSEWDVWFWPLFPTPKPFVHDPLLDAVAEVLRKQSPCCDLLERRFVGGIDAATPKGDKTVINPAWGAAGPSADVVFVSYTPGAYESINVGPKPKKVCACKRTQAPKLKRKPSKTRVIRTTGGARVKVGLKSL